MKGDARPGEIDMIWVCMYTIYECVLFDSLLTPGAHVAQRELQYLVCKSVCLSVTTFSATTRNNPAKRGTDRFSATLA